MHREPLRDYLAGSSDLQPSKEAVDDILLAEPFHDPSPDWMLSVNVDHYLYGTPKRRPRRR